MFSRNLLSKSFLSADCSISVIFISLEFCLVIALDVFFEAAYYLLIFTNLFICSWSLDLRYALSILASMSSYSSCFTSIFPFRTEASLFCKRSTLSLESLLTDISRCIIWFFISSIYVLLYISCICSFISFNFRSCSSSKTLSYASFNWTADIPVRCPGSKLAYY